MIKKLFIWVEGFANSRYKLQALFWVAFTEASFFLVPPDVLLAPIALYKKYSARFLAVFTSIASTLGGVFGYFIGYLFFNLFGNKILDFYNAEDAFLKVKNFYEDSVFISTFIAAFTPIPYKVFTLAAGVTAVNIFVFILASLLGRGLRFYLVGFVAERYGLKILEKFIFKYDKVFFIFGIIILVLIYFLR